MSGDYHQAKQDRQLALIRSVHGGGVRDDGPRPVSFDGGARSESYQLPGDATLDRLRLLRAGWIPVDQE